MPYIVALNFDIYFIGGDFMYINRTNDSWSYSKQAAFEYCERKYFYQYHAKRILQENCYFEQADTINLLCKSIPFKIWIERTLKTRLRELFLKTQSLTDSRNFLNKLKADVYRSFYKDRLLLSSTNSDFKITEAINKLHSIGETVFKAENYLNDIFSTLKLCRIFKTLTQVKQQEKINTSSPLCFMLDNIQIYNAPVLAWFHKTTLISVNIFFASNNNKLIYSDWDYLSAVNHLYWRSRFRDMPINIENINIMLNTAEQFSYAIYAKGNIHDTIKKIKYSYEKISSRKNYYGKIFIDNYKPTSDNKKCLSCSFYKRCSEYEKIFNF